MITAYYVRNAEKRYAIAYKIACGIFKSTIYNQSRNYQRFNRLEPDDRESVYLPGAIAPTVKRMVGVERQPVSKVLKYIQARKK
ncbi:MAG: hypothetical protein QNJ46_10460 [Leptolyngbyaceae cyanobacterium MO_188.B28]|nr:hypothetical protein [Leptolyngbyaceae cyanobacterium MO_188.B28]